MKKLIAIALMLATFNMFGADAFTFVNDGDYGYSYVKINQDIESFSFKPDWHSLGNAGKVGYVVYAADMSDTDRAAYMEVHANNPQFQKKVNDGVVEIKNLKAGEGIGFYEVRPNGSTYTQTAFKDWHGQTWLAFDKNGGHGKDEWMSIGNVTTTTPAAPTGAPLPGALAAMLVGLTGAGAYKFRKTKKNVQ